MRPRVLAMVLAGGEGSRLHPLTAERSKPAVPFAGRYRIVDFVVSNLVNSGIFSIYLLVQYKSQSLIDHVRRAWVLSPMFPEQFVTVVPPQLREGPDWFEGTSDAVYQNLALLDQHDPELVVVFGADHVYRMDVCQMIDFHDARGADVTVAALPVPRRDASGFGVIDARPDGRVTGFLEKPAQPPAMPGRPDHAYASMGNYVFGADVLRDALLEANKRRETDFGRHVLPRLLASHAVYAYDFSANRVPGVRDYEEAAYWRDVGTIGAYFAAHQDVLGMEPRFNLFNPAWRIGSSAYQGPSPRIVNARIDNSILGAGSLVKGARIAGSVIRREVVLEEDVELDECIVMDYTIVRRGARLRRAIVDRYNVIEEGTRIGYAAQDDARRYPVDECGVVIVPRGDGRDGHGDPDVARYL